MGKILEEYITVEKSYLEKLIFQYFDEVVDLSTIFPEEKDFPYSDYAIGFSVKQKNFYGEENKAGGNLQSWLNYILREKMYLEENKIVFIIMTL